VGGDGPARQRFVVVRNLQEAERRLEELRQLAGEPHKKAACEL